MRKTSAIASYLSEFYLIQNHRPGDKLEVLKTQLRKVVEEKDGLLTDNERNLFVLHVYESRSLRECARRLKIKEQNLKPLLFKTILKLREYFKE